MTGDAELSKLLWDAREQIAMWIDVVEIRTGQTDESGRRTIDGIDRYRAERGWSPHGFGGEEEPRPRSEEKPA